MCHRRRAAASDVGPSRDAERRRRLEPAPPWWLRSDEAAENYFAGFTTLYLYGNDAIVWLVSVVVPLVGTG